jgi:hypothetical protein
MRISASKLATGALAVICSLQMALPVMAQNTYSARVNRYYGNLGRQGTYFQRHPKVKAAAIGAG